MQKIIRRKSFPKIFFHVFWKIALTNGIFSARILKTNRTVQKVDWIENVTKLIFPFNQEVVLASDIPMGKDRIKFFHAGKLAQLQKLIKLFLPQKIKKLYLDYSAALAYFTTRKRKGRQPDNSKGTCPVIKTRIRHRDNIQREFCRVKWKFDTKNP